MAKTPDKPEAAEPEAAATADTAVEAEATGAKMVKVEHKGLTYLVPGTFEDWPVEAEILLEQGHDAWATKELLGAEQWALFTATRPTVRDRKELVTAIMTRFSDQGN